MIVKYCLHHNPCFNIFLLHHDSLDNQGRKINKNDVFLRFNILSFTTSFQATFFVEFLIFFFFFFVILHILAKCHFQTVFTSHIFKLNLFHA